MTPAVSLVVVNYRQAQLAARCVESAHRAFEAENIAGEIIVVDCGSGEAEKPALAALPAELCLLPDNRGYSGGLNAGLARAQSARLVLSNADVLFRPGAFTELVRTADDPRVGACAPVCSWDDAGRVLLPPGFDPGFLQELAMLRGPRSRRRDERRFARFAREAVRLWTHGGPARHLSGAVLAVRRDVFDRVGRFDERFLFEYEETEWEARVRAAGLELRVAATARVRHLWGGSAAGEPETERRRAESKSLFRRRRYGALGRALLERAQRRTHAAASPALARRAGAELAARPGAWLAFSPHASGFPFAGADLECPFRVPPEVRTAMPPGPWLWTVFRGVDGAPLDAWWGEP
ncbi:MAG: glycosyltransferase [Acidobacteriota bacterium]